MSGIPLAIDRKLVEVPYDSTFWGQPVRVDPHFVKTVLGDGLMLLGMTTINSRPNYYVIRVDSTWHLSMCRKCEDECPDQLFEHLEEIYEAIVSEYGCAIDEETGNKDPWPAFDDENGCSWFSFSDDEVRKLTLEVQP